MRQILLLVSLICISVTFSRADPGPHYRAIEDYLQGADCDDSPQEILRISRAWLEKLISNEKIKIGFRCWRSDGELRKALAHFVALEQIKPDNVCSYHTFLILNQVMYDTGSRILQKDAQLGRVDRVLLNFLKLRADTCLDRYGSDLSLAQQEVGLAGLKAIEGALRRLHRGSWFASAKFDRAYYKRVLSQLMNHLDLQRDIVGPIRGVLEETSDPEEILNSEKSVRESLDRLFLKPCEMYVRNVKPLMEQRRLDVTTAHLLQGKDVRVLAPVDEYKAKLAYCSDLTSDFIREMLPGAILKGNISSDVTAQQA